MPHPRRQARLQGPSARWLAALEKDARGCLERTAECDQLSCLPEVHLGVVCHQRPERSFHWHGAQLAVCARCTGIYLGACTTALLAPLPPSLYARWAGPPARLARLLAVAALPMAATLAAEWTGVWLPSSIARAATGVLLGAAVALVVTAALAIHYGECLPRTADEPRRPRRRQPQTRI